MALEAPQELQALEASPQLCTLQAPPLEPEPIIIDQVDNLLPQLAPPSIKFLASNNSRALPSSTRLLTSPSSETNELNVALPTPNKKERLILKPRMKSELENLNFIKKSN